MQTTFTALESYHFQPEIQAPLLLYVCCIGEVQSLRRGLNVL